MTELLIAAPGSPGQVRACHESIIAAASEPRPAHGKTTSIGRAEHSDEWDTHSRQCSGERRLRPGSKCSPPRSCAQSQEISLSSGCSRGRRCLSPTTSEHSTERRPPGDRVYPARRSRLAKESSGNVQVLGDVPTRPCRGVARRRHRRFRPVGGLVPLSSCAGRGSPIGGPVRLDKPQPRAIEVRLDFVGLSIGNVFVAGYGTDYAERYRHLPYIGMLE